MVGSVSEGCVFFVTDALSHSLVRFSVFANLFPTYVY